MKTHLLILIGVAGILAFQPFPTRADFEVSGSVSIDAKTDFDVPLSPLGDWVEVGSYGHCWHPRGVSATWRPYCEGTWVWTDDGWYWQSSEPWAWACYHYGTWVYDSDLGWCWVPDVVWAPSWVIWRTSDDYVGWVPCAPPGFVFEPRFFVFVQSRHFCDPVRPSVVIVNNTEIINHTTVINSFSHENREIGGRTHTVVINQGPRVDFVEKATGRHFKPTPIQQADRRTFNSIPKVVRERSTLTEPSHDLQRNPSQQPSATTDRNFSHNAGSEHNVNGSTTTPPNDNGGSPKHWWSSHPSQPKSTEPKPEPAQPQRPEQSVRPEQPQRPEQPVQPVQPQHPEQVQPQHPERPSESQRPEQSTQPQRPERPEQPLQPQRPEPQQPQAPHQQNPPSSSYYPGSNPGSGHGGGNPSPGQGGGPSHGGSTAGGPPPNSGHGEGGGGDRGGNQPDHGRDRDNGNGH